MEWVKVSAFAAYSSEKNLHCLPVHYTTVPPSGKNLSEVFYFKTNL